MWKRKWWNFRASASTASASSFRFHIADYDQDRIVSGKQVIDAAFSYDYYRLVLKNKLFFPIIKKK